MPRPTRTSPERGSASVRLLDAARDLFREQGYAATSIDDLCAAAEVTRGAFFHHFPTKEAFGVAVAERWQTDVTALFAAAPYHAPCDPLDRVFAYIALRRSMIEGEIAGFTCLAGTLIQETWQSSPPIRAACASAILSHAASLEADLEEALRDRGLDGQWSAASLARHTQTVIQGAFVLVKATGDPATAREALDHLDQYFRLLFRVSGAS